MPEKKFELGDYVEVKDRIRILYELFPQARIETDYHLTAEPDDKPKVIVRALVYRKPEDEKPAGHGTSWLYLPGSTPYTRGSEIENAETSAVGRAIGMLGILIVGGMASKQEIQNKQDSNGTAERRTTHADGLIGKAIAQGTQDFQLRQGPDGPALPFRVKAGRLSQIAVATGAIATALDTYRDETLNQRITVWGYYTDETYPKKDPASGEIVDIGYKVLHVERIKTPAFEMPPYDIPGMDALSEVESETLPWDGLTDEEKELIGAGLPE